MRSFARQIPKISRGWWFALFLAPNLVAAPVFHERFTPDPAEDLRFGATTPSGSLPAAIQTLSGVIAAPEEAQTKSSSGKATYGGSQTQNSADASYHLDKLTTRPERVQYDEPFRPSLLPYKRLYAFDAVRADMSLAVGVQKLEALAVGGVAEKSEDLFFADFEVDLVAELPVRIPAVGPGARLRALNLDPPGPVEILKDGAENWFARATYSGRVRFVMQVSVDRDTFGSQFSTTNWHNLQGKLHPLPPEVRRIAVEVLEHIGVDQSYSPARALVALVDYFRRFKESAQLPIADDPGQLYRELSLSRKGVCRHRAYAFSVTALALGLPTRLVHNEAHAWVEVFDSEIWHRVDLGGAAADIQESDPDPLVPNHRPPRDPYLWPNGAESALSSVNSPIQSPAPVPLNGAVGGEIGQHPGAGTVAAQDPGSASLSRRVASSDSSGGDTSPGSSYEITLHLGTKSLLRGRPLSLRGHASREGRPCVLSRVDIFVQGATGPQGIGSVATDRGGEFSGQVTLPHSTPVGALRVFAQVAGGCNE